MKKLISFVFVAALSLFSFIFVCSADSPDILNRFPTWDYDITTTAQPYKSRKYMNEAIKFCFSDDCTGYDRNDYYIMVYAYIPANADQPGLNYDISFYILAYDKATFIENGVKVTIGLPSSNVNLILCDTLTDYSTNTKRGMCVVNHKKDGTFYRYNDSQANKFNSKGYFGLPMTNRPFYPLYTDFTLYQGYYYSSSNIDFGYDHPTLFEQDKNPLSISYNLGSSLDVTYSLSPEAVLPAKYDVVFKIYDRAPAIEAQVFTPHSYVSVDYDGNTTVGRTLMVVNTAPLVYSFSYDTLQKYCSPDHPYRLYSYYLGSNKELIEISYFDFRLDPDGFYKILHNVSGHGPIKVTDYDGNGKPDYTDITTGQTVNPDDLIFTFNSDVNTNIDPTGIDIPDFDFKVELGADLTQGAGLVRTLFDKFIEVSGLSSYFIVVLVISVVGWFIFGSRR